jgi:hypothetical protein
MTTVSPAASAICRASYDTIPTWGQSNLRPDRNSLPGDLGRYLCGAQHLYHIHRHVNLGQRGEHVLSEKFATAVGQRFRPRPMTKLITLL